MLSNNSIITDIKQIIEQSRESAIRSVAFVGVQNYWHIAEWIFELRPHCRRNSLNL